METTPPHSTLTAIFFKLLRPALWHKFSSSRVDGLLDDMMTAALENILRGQPREATRLTAYIRGICSNLTKKEMRPKTDDNLVDLDLERISDSEKSVVDSLIEQERAAAVRQVLETLSFRDRNLLIDLFFHELSRDEACRKYAVTRGQLRVVLHHARRRFQKKWAR